MDGFIARLIESTIAIFVLVNPVGNVPVYLDILSRVPEGEKRRVTNVATITAFIVLVVFTILGTQLLEYVFRVRKEDFMIGGGIILLLIAIKALVGQGTVEAGADSTKISVVPLAFPMLIGPGSMITGLLIFQNYGPITALLAIVLVFASVWCTFRWLDLFRRFLGDIGSLILAKIKYVFIAALAVRFIMDGILCYFPHLR